MDKPLLATMIRRVHLLIRQHVLDDLHAAGHADLTAAQMYIFQSPGPEGLRPTELAAGTNTTKQAMNHMLVALEQAGYLQRKQSPTDGRATIIHLTNKGRDVERIMIESAGRLERIWTRSTGRSELEQFRVLLQRIDAVARQSSTSN